MPKFLIQASYTGEGLRALRQDKGVARVWAVKDAVTSLGGKVIAFYWALGEDEAVLILDLPDAETAAALSMHVGAAGLVRTKTTRLLDLKDIEAALGKSIDYQVPDK